MKEQNQGLFLWLAGMAVTAAALGFGLRAASQAHDSVLAEKNQARMQRELAAGSLVVMMADGAIPLEDPFAAAWEQAPVREVPVVAQKMVMPKLDQATVSKIQVQALANGTDMVWRLVWDDPQPEANVDSGRFCDAVALQFPLAADAVVTMGGYGAAVQILHWKALWQKDVDEHFQDVQDVHPNYWADLYWFAVKVADAKPNAAAYRVPESFADSLSHAWFPAYAAGNPVSDFHRKNPVEELVAEGFGTLSNQQQCDAGGRGIWRDGKWHVVIHRPLQTEDPFDRQFSNLARGDFAVAVWDGEHGNVGGRKHHSEWVPFVMVRP